MVALTLCPALWPALGQASCRGGAHSGRSRQVTARYELEDGWHQQAYRFELGQNNAQRGQLASHTGAARFAYNWGPARVRADLDVRRVLEVLAMRQGASKEEASAFSTELLGPVLWNLYALRKLWNAEKPEVAAWWLVHPIPSPSASLPEFGTAITAHMPIRGRSRPATQVRPAHRARRHLGGRGWSARRPIRSARGASAGRQDWSDQAHQSACWHSSVTRNSHTCYGCHPPF